jgi:hypothetical protein
MESFEVLFLQMQPYFISHLKLVLEWVNLLMRFSEALFLQMQPYFISHLKIVWYPMLITVFLVLGIGFLQNIMKLLLDVMDSFNTFGCLINLCLSMRGFFICNYNGQSYINGGQWLEPKAHLKRDVSNRFMDGFVVDMLNIGNDLIPCAWMFVIVHP